MYLTTILAFALLWSVSALDFGGLGHFDHSFGNLGKFGNLGIGLSHDFIGPKHFGGSHLTQSNHGEGKSLVNGEQFHKAFGAEDAALNHGLSGFSKGEGLFKDIKGDSGYFYGADGENKKHQTGGDFYGAKLYGQEGKAGGEKAVKEGHKKGHVIKGYTTSHHKDEHGKTEQYFDEEHDEGGEVAYDGKSGTFGEEGKSAVKGSQEDGKFSAGDAKKGVHYEHEHIDGKAQANHGHFGESKHAGQGKVLGDHKISDVGDFAGHHNSEHFFKHYPSFHY